MSDVDHGEPEPAPEHPLDADALAMLRAYRAEERIPAEVHERVWSRVRADVEAPRGQWLRYGAVVGGLAAAALAMLWLGGQVLRGEPRAPASQAGYEREGGAPQGVVEPPSRPSASPSPIREGETPAAIPGQAERATPGAAPAERERAPLGAATTSETTPSRGSAARRAPQDDRPPSPPTPAPGSTLAEESRLLKQARSALVDAQPEQALARLAEHARRFPAGVLTEEREALRAVALCEAGREADGDAAAQAFLREHPQAALAERVRSACLE